jgi:hypothetical protein
MKAVGAPTDIALVGNLRSQSTGDVNVMATQPYIAVVRFPFVTPRQELSDVISSCI